jgi:hypothetical protein
LDFEEIYRINSLSDDKRNEELHKLSPKDRDHYLISFYGFSANELEKFYSVLGKPEYDDFMDKWLEKKMTEFQNVVEQDKKLKKLEEKLVDAFAEEKLIEKLMKDSRGEEEGNISQKGYDKAIERRKALESELEDRMIDIIKPHSTPLEIWQIEHIGKEKLGGNSNSTKSSTMSMVEGKKDELKQYVLQNIPLDVPKSEQLNDMLKVDEKILFTIPEITLMVHNTDEEDTNLRINIDNRNPDRGPSNASGFNVYSKRNLVVTNKRLLLCEIKSKDKVMDYVSFDENERYFFWMQRKYWSTVWSLKHRGLKGYASVVLESYKMFAKGFVGTNKQNILPNYWGFVMNPTFTMGQKKKGLLGRGGTEVTGAGIKFTTDGGFISGGERSCSISCGKEYVDDMEHLSKLMTGHKVPTN